MNRRGVFGLEEELKETLLGLARVYSEDLLRYDEKFLVKSFLYGCKKSGLDSPRRYCEYLEQNSAEADSFFKSLHIPFSQFFREPILFAYLEQRLLPNLLNHTAPGGEIRIWSAGCAGGQEAYSIAMLLESLLENAPGGLRYRIFATDISQEAILHAKSGEYLAADVQNVKIKYLQKYLFKSGNHYTVSPALKENIVFSSYDLLDTNSVNPPESIFGNFDMIFCANVMMYYNADARAYILRKMERALTNNGFLILSEAERAFVKSQGIFHPVTHPLPIFQKPDH